MSSNPLGAMCFFLILARRPLYGEWECARGGGNRKDRIGNGRLLLQS
jgi:hypothetical protein